MNKQELIKRIKSYLWRAAGVGVVAGLSSLVESISGSGFSPLVITMVGLFVGEITKFINNRLSLK